MLFFSFLPFSFISYPSFLSGKLENLEITSVGSINADEDGYGVFLSNLAVSGLANAEVSVESSSLNGTGIGKGW